MKYITVTHVDGKTKVRAKVVKETTEEVEVEYRLQGMTWGLHLTPPTKH
jgi:hypothetical protein